MNNTPTPTTKTKSPFEHYMYVVECADGTLYTGYAVNVEARVAAHNAGKGAKYTKTRRPVHLLGKAHFFTKQRAMSAEWHFKQLSRDEKDALLVLSAKQPFEGVLTEHLPGFESEPIAEFAARLLSEQINENYRSFNSKLLPTVNSATMVGVRTPALRKIARQMAKRSDLEQFFKATPHALFEENQLHSFALEYIKDYDQAVAHLEAFLPYVDNWATCDQLPTKILATKPKESLDTITRWLASKHVFTARYAIGALMHNYLGEHFDLEHLAWVASKHVPGFEKPAPASGAYYLNMMRAWYFAEAIVKQPSAALPYLLRPKQVIEKQIIEDGTLRLVGNGALDEWTRKKAIQKSVESFRVSDELKATLKAAR